MEENQNPTPVSPKVQTPPIEPVSNPTKPKSKFPVIIIGIILFFLIVVSAAGFYVMKNMKPKPTPYPTIQKSTPTPNPTANLKTYTDNTYGYSLKYPSSLNLVPKSQDNPQNDHFQITNEPDPKAPGLYLSAPDNQYYEIDVLVQSANGQTLQDLSKQFDGYKNRKDYTRTSSSLDGISGYKVTDVSLDSISDITYVLENGYVYNLILRHFPETKNLEEGKSIYNQVLSTFKFISSNPTIDISDWKTFNGPLGKNYSFKYPPSWFADPDGVYNPKTVYDDGNGGDITTYKEKVLYSFLITNQTTKQFVDDVEKREKDSKNPPALIKAFSRKSIIIYGQSVEDYTIGGEAYGGTYIVFSNGKSVAQFGPLDNYPSANIYINQILSTFKFTN